ncbi:Catabolite control protein A [Brevundimonas subvibrioides]|uniref:LacI family DNA-binding transcriptional regulator n=1 Tax=Brevundimonas subvibrioides TaxID=74313 RepID=UPI0032D575AA
MAGSTIYDVAAAASVSIKSVSRVLNGEPNVSEALKARVGKAVEELGYRRSLSARGLAGSSSSVIAALVDAGMTIEHWRSGSGNDYLSRLELGVLMELRQVDYHLMVEMVDYASPTLSRDLAALLSSIRPEGVLLTPPNSDLTVVLDVLDASGVAYARLGAEHELDRGTLVSMDERQAARDMTEHLIALGHRRIGFIGGPAVYSASRLRLEGFMAAMQAHGLEVPDDCLAEGDFTFAAGVAGVKRLLGAERAPTAIFGACDDMALGAIQGAVALGVRVPDDLSVAGFDDSPSAMFSNPTLTTIRQPVAEMAAAAVQRLTPPLRARLSQEDRTAAVVVPYRLVARASTAAPPPG